MPERVDITEEGRLRASDHMLVLAKVTVNAGPAPAPAGRGLQDWNKADWLAMRREMAELDWIALMRGKTAEQACSLLKESMHSLVAKHMPEKRRRNHNRLPWLSREILRVIRRKKRLWRAAKQGRAAGRGLQSS
jgi:hypothetical protein